MTENIFLLKKIHQEQCQEVRTITISGPTFFEKFLEDRKQMGADKWSRKFMEFVRQQAGRSCWEEGSGQKEAWG